MDNITKNDTRRQKRAKKKKLNTGTTALNQPSPQPKPEVLGPSESTPIPRQNGTKVIEGLTINVSPHLEPLPATGQEHSVSLTSYSRTRSTWLFRFSVRVSATVDGHVFGYAAISLSGSAVIVWVVISRTKRPFTLTDLCRMQSCLLLPQRLLPCSSRIPLAPEIKGQLGIYNQYPKPSLRSPTDLHEAADSKECCSRSKHDLHHTARARCVCNI